MINLADISGRFVGLVANSFIVSLKWFMGRTDPISKKEKGKIRDVTKK